jgi:hypothetical protein
MTSHTKSRTRTAATFSTGRPSVSLIRPSALPSKIPNTIPTEAPDSVDLPEGAGVVVNGQTYENFSTIEAANSYRTLKSSVTGCYAQDGAMPMLLADRDTCNLGFFCPNSTNVMPPQ